jgi:hypothetical protein
MPGICDTPIGKTLSFCSIPQAVDQAAGAVAGSAFEQVVNAIAKAANELVKVALTFFLKTPSPDLNAGLVPWIQGHTNYLVGAISVAAVLIAAGRLAIERRAEPARDLGIALLRVVLVSTATVTVVSLLLSAGDIWSDWIIQQADGPITLQNIILIAPAAPYLTSGLAMLLGLVLLLGAFFQLLIMIVRGAMIVLLCGTLPLAAAASTTETGKQWFQKSLGWLTAFVLYKPVAALIYAAAFQMISARDDLLTKITGITLLLMAILALPALMKFLVPVTAQLGGANGMTGAISVAGAAVGAVATGAVLVASGGASGFAGGAASSVGSIGPSGNAGTAGLSGPGGPATSGPPGGTSSGGGGSPGTGNGGTVAAGSAVTDGISQASSAGHAASGAASTIASGDEEKT